MTKGWFGEFGGSFAPETLMEPLRELTESYERAREDESFQQELTLLFREYVGRPTPLTLAARASAHLGGAQIYLKREDLAHTGAHKINNTIGQVLLAKRMGKKRVIAETGAGQHGVATATAAAYFGLQCVVYMGEVDMARQALNVFRMRLLGAQVRGVASGSKTLKDAINEAMRDWVTNVKETHYVLGSVLGPHPYPTIVRDFQRVIGDEAREQIMKAAGRLPDEVVACVGGGSNAIGIFTAFVGDESVALTGVEGGGRGVSKLNEHAARLTPDAAGSLPGVLHGTRTYVLQDTDGQVLPTHSVSAGLDYPAVGPEHAELFAKGRASYTAAKDDEALAAFDFLCQHEGIIPALESSHAVAYAIERAPKMGKDEIIIVNLSGRGDKDVEQIKKMKEEGQNG